MSSMHPGAAAWRHIRSDRSVVDNRIDPARYAGCSASPVPIAA